MQNRNSRTIRALIVEDVDSDATLLERALARNGFEPACRRVDNREDLLKALDEDWDIVFSDYTMPGFSGKDALETIREYSDDLPFIFVSGTIGEDVAVEAVKAGAQDYIIKGQYKRLPVAVEHALRAAEMKRAHRQAQERIDRLINVDTLTNTASRAYFLEALVEALQHAQEEGNMVGVFFVNVDNFRSINDRMGISGGDSLIVQLSERLSEMLPPDAVVARLYADQFAVMMPAIKNEQHAAEYLDILLGAFYRPFTVNRYNKKVTCSIGYCLFPEDGKDLELLLSNATLAQAVAKRGSGNSARRYSTRSREEFEKRVFLESELERAIERGEFVMHYQPQVDVKTGKIVGAESLVRWVHPEKGFISPMDFIPIAEETGLILPLGDEVCRLACRQLASWIGEGLPQMRIAVNISGQQFQYDGFVEYVNDTVTALGIDPHWIELEITETALMSDPDLAFSTMSAFNRLGFNIALDDFGTGYSSLSYLDRFPIDTLKIDRSFTSRLPDDPRKASIVQAIIGMAETLGVRVVAEGIETAAQLAFLEDAGCDILQGYFIQRPAPADVIRPLLMEGVIRR